jgi:hypothetical protein
VCEAFHVLPSAAIRELEEGPAGLVWQILEERGYEARLRQIERAAKDEHADIDEDELTDLIREIGAEVDGEIADEVLGRRRNG